MYNKIFAIPLEIMQGTGEEVILNEHLSDLAKAHCMGLLLRLNAASFLPAL